ncbi:MAG: molecular chaperone DnaK [Thermodesulfobacteriota bacterium]
MGKIIGIDLGTTNSVVSLVEGGEAKIIVNEEGERTTPSTVAFTKEDGVLVGGSAKRQAVVNPADTIYSSKRLMGRRLDEVKDLVDKLPYGVVSSPEGKDAWIEAEDKKYSPPQIASHVLMKLKKAAESYTGSEITEAVITVPAYFNDSQRQATKDAGKIAGLKVDRIINEPTAAALAYGFDNQKDRKIVVYDLGGGTFDVSVLEISDGVIEVKSTGGDTSLGGDDFDRHIIAYITEEFKKDSGIDLSGDKMAIQRLREAAEKAKIELSSKLETEVNLPFVTADSSGAKHLVMKITRSKLEQLIDPLVKGTLEPCKNALKDSGLKASDISEVLLVGGSTRMPLVQKTVTEFFGREPHKGINPDEVVAMGAAIQGAVLSGDVKDVLLLDVTPLSLGIETLGGVMTPVVEANTTIPTEKSQVFTTAEDNQPQVEIHVLQGERKMSSDNRTLARFILDKIPPAQRGMPQIEVSFDIDANGILHVAAKDKATGEEQKVKVESSSGLSQDEIDRMIDEAKENSEDDEKKHQSVQAKNQLDQLIYSTEKTFEEHKDKLSEEEKKELEQALESGKAAIKSDNPEEMEKAQEAITKASHNLAEIMYKQQQEANGAEPAGGNTGEKQADGKKGDDDSGEVIDAEITDK